MLRFLPILLFISLLSSCGPLGRAVSKMTPDRQEEDEEVGAIPESLLPGSSSNEGIEPTEVREVGAGQDPAKAGGIVGLPTEEEILFLDPDDFEAAEAALAGLSSIQKRDWLTSHSVARNYAMLEGKPLLIIFTDTPGPRNTGSPSGNSLEKELLARTDFSEWAEERFVRLKLDFNVKDRNSADSEKKEVAIRKEKYLESLKKRYGVRGLPVILVLASDGTEVQRVRGYQTGNYEFAWGLLRTAEKVAQDKQLAFEKTLEKKGYRRWKGKNDQRILARLVAYDEGKLTLIAPNGRRHETHESSLSAEDRKWLAGAKAKSEARR